MIDVSVYLTFATVVDTSYIQLFSKQGKTVNVLIESEGQKKIYNFKRTVSH